MDPDAALAELLELVAEYRDDEEELDLPMWALSVAEHIESLHEWLVKDGALPSDWNGKQGAEHDSERRRVVSSFESELLPTTRSALLGLIGQAFTLGWTAHAFRKVT